MNSNGRFISDCYVFPQAVFGPYSTRGRIGSACDKMFDGRLLVNGRRDESKRSGRISRRGTTIIELLIVFAIIGVLASLVAAGVLSAREAARKMQCANHLKQLGIAVHNYHSVHNYLPCSGLLGLRYLSTFLEGQPGNWDVYGTPDPCMAGSCPEAGDWSRPKVYLCPTDPLVHRTKRSASYVFSSGLWMMSGGGVGVSDGYGAADESANKAAALRDITDGTSQTACASEQLISPIRTASTPEEYLALLPLTSVPSDDLRYSWYFSGAFTQPSQLDALFAECDLSTFAEIHSAGYPFNCRVVSYSHVRTPNTRSCLASSPATTLIGGSVNPATSRHSGGVNVLLCDGAVRFVSNSVARSVWHAVGTRSGSDAVGEW